MVYLNVEKILEEKDKSKYWLFNQINNIRSQKQDKQISYTNFRHLIEQQNISIRYQDIDELCEALNCSISKLLIRNKD